MRGLSDVNVRRIGMETEKRPSFNSKHLQL